LGAAVGVQPRVVELWLLAGRQHRRILLFLRLSVEPDVAYYEKGLGEFLLPYAAVREADDPDGVLLGFLQSTYEAAADLAGWDRAALEVT
jgi:hypothetical protein